MSKTNKIHVYQNYDLIYSWFDENRNKNMIEISYLELITKMISPGASILDLGCGTSEPIAKYFIERGYKVTGVDGSYEMIKLCKKRFPNERWIVSDMREISLNNKYDIIIAWHSYFHLDHASQRAMFEIFRTHLNFGGILVFTSGSEHGEVWSNNGGQELYHASLSTQEYKQLLESNSFKVLVHNVADKDCGDATVWVAQYV